MLSLCPNISEPVTLDDTYDVAVGKWSVAIRDDSLLALRKDRLDVKPTIWAQLLPLRSVCAVTGQLLPRVEPVERNDVPEPYKSLLVHDKSMTETLERYHKQTLYVEVLSKKRNGHLLNREVVLRRYGDDVAVEYATITMALGWLPMEVRGEVVEGRRPLGKILHEHDIDYRSCPVGYVMVKPTEHIYQALGMSDPVEVYGRVNRLFNAAWHPIADVVEMLPVRVEDAARREEMSGEQANQLTHEKKESIDASART